MWLVSSSTLRAVFFSVPGACLRTKPPNEDKTRKVNKELDVFINLSKEICSRSWTSSSTVAQIHVGLTRTCFFINRKYNFMPQMFTLKYITQYAPVFSDDLNITSYMYMYAVTDGDIILTSYFNSNELWLISLVWILQYITLKLILWWWTNFHSFSIALGELRFVFQETISVAHESLIKWQHMSLLYGL